MRIVRLASQLLCCCALLIATRASAAMVNLQVDEAQVAAMQALAAALSQGGDTLIITGKNLQIVSGSGSSDGTRNGKGNLIIGYNETEGLTLDRGGSHNLVMGRGHQYSEYGGIVQGLDNSCLGDYCVALGVTSTAYDYSSVLGGVNNTAGSEGEDNYAVVVGGYNNEAPAYAATVLGGNSNVASANYASAGGGADNTASGQFSWVAGGDSNTASGYAACIGGGRLNVASGYWSQADAGYNHSTSATFGWVHP